MAKDKNKTSSATKPEMKAVAVALHGSNTLPALINIGENRPELQLGDVVARAHQASGLSIEDWNALADADRDEKLIAVIEALRDDARALDANANGNQDSAAPDAGHIDSQGNDTPGASDAAPGVESRAGDAADLVIDKDKEPEGGWCYPVLTPFKLRGVIVKEGFVQLTTKEAGPYLAAGVIGDDVYFPPDSSEGAE